MNLKTFSGRNFRELRQESGLRQTEFREALLEKGASCGENNVGNWELRGRVPTGDNIYAIMVVLNEHGVECSLEDLYE